MTTRSSRNPTERASLGLALASLFALLCGLIDCNNRPPAAPSTRLQLIAIPFSAMDKASAPTLYPQQAIEEEATVYALELQDNGSPSLHKTVSSFLLLPSLESS